MSTISKDSIAKTLYELCNEFYKLEKFYEKNLNKPPIKCYLIESKSIDSLKNEIKYDKLKEYIKENISPEQFKNVAKGNNSKIIINLHQEKFNNSNDLLTELNKKKYYIVNNNFASKILKISNDTCMTVSLNKKEIIIAFNENDKLTFKYNSLGKIDKSMLNPNSNSEIFQKKPFNNYEFKNDLEILIRLYYNFRFLKGKRKKEFEPINDENSEVVYLLNNNLIAKYKSFYEYQDLENYLSQLNDKLNITNFKNISKDNIEKIISNLPGDYIKKLEAKKKIEIKEKIDKYETQKFRGKYNSKDIDIPYSINNHIINSSIYTALTSEKISAQLKSCDLYFIDNKKILLHNKMDFNSAEIGYINEENIFVPEFILYSTNIQLSQLNNFLKKDFPAFCSNRKNESCIMRYDNSFKAGACFRVKENSFAYNVHNTNNISQSKNNHTITNLPLDSTQKYIQKYIELFYQIYLFYEEINNKINSSLINSKLEQYYIINNKWMNKFLAYFEYSKFMEYMKKGNTIEITKKYKNNNIQYLVEIMNLLPNDYSKTIKSKIDDKDEFNKIIKAEYYKLELKGRESIQNKVIYYYDANIEIINVEIYNYVKSIINIQNENKKDFLIGDNKIIMKNNESYQCSLIIGDYIDLSFAPSILIDFEMQKYYDEYFKKFIEKGYNETMKNIDTNQKIFKIYDNFSTEIIAYSYNLKKLNDIEYIKTIPNSSSFINNNNLANINSQKEKVSSVENSNTTEENNPRISEKKEINKISLNNFMQNQIKALILYYYFIEDIKKKIILSSENQSKFIYNCGKCYLIDECWMNTYKNFFEFQELIKQIKIIANTNSFNIEQKNFEIIITKLDKQYINIIELREKEKKNPDQLFESLTTENLNFVENHEDKIIVKKPPKYHIINQEI